MTTPTPADELAERRTRYAATVRHLHDTGGVYALDAGEAERIADAVMAVADAEQAELRRLLAQAQAEAHQYRTALQGAARRESAAAPAVDRAAPRDRVAEALAREDAHNAGYDHGFAASYGADDETDGFVDAVLAVLPPPASRADVIAEAIRRVEDPEERAKTTTGLGLGWEAARDVLRRLADETPGAEAAPDTLPAWLYQRFMPHGVGWESLDEDDRSQWEHQARAVRRAVARGGFKQPAAGARQDGATP